MDGEGTGLSWRIADVPGMDAAARGAQKMTGVDRARIFAGGAPDFSTDGQLVGEGEGFHIKYFFPCGRTNSGTATRQLKWWVDRQNRRAPGACGPWPCGGGW